MITVTGKIENAAGETLHARIDFISRSTPLVGAGVITTNTDKTLRSNPEDGTFSVALAPGNYQVVITAEGQTTTFNIAVPDGSGSAGIETLTTTPLSYPFVAPNTVWNGTRSGHITFEPLANPPAPTTTAIQYLGGGHQGATDSNGYRICWENANFELTAPGPEVTSTAPTAPNDATRVNLPAPPAGVINVLIFRSAHDGTAKRYLLATVAPNVTHYDDWENTADFSTRLDPTLVPPLYNQTAGGILSSAGNAAAYFTDQGIYIPGANARLRPNKGLQLYNFDTGLWHTLLAAGNPPQIGLDAGEL